MIRGVLNVLIFLAALASYTVCRDVEFSVGESIVLTAATLAVLGRHVLIFGFVRRSEEPERRLGRYVYGTVASLLVLVLLVTIAALAGMWYVAFLVGCGFLLAAVVMGPAVIIVAIAWRRGGEDVGTEAGSASEKLFPTVLIGALVTAVGLDVAIIWWILSNASDSLRTAPDEADPSMRFGALGILLGAAILWIIVAPAIIGFLRGREIRRRVISEGDE